MVGVFGHGPFRLAMLTIAAVLLVGLAPSSRAEAATTGSVTAVSESGDYIGAGQNLRFQAPDEASLSGTLSEVDVTTGSRSTSSTGNLTLDFAAPSGQQLSAGEYNDAQRWPFEPAGVAGLTIDADSRGCNEDYGRFVVKDIHADSSGNVDRFWALFEQHCEQTAAPALYGEVRLGEPAGTASEQAEPAAVAWPATAVGATGDHVPVTIVAGAGGAQISSVSIAGPDATDFTVGTDDCSGASLPPGAACQTLVAVTPHVEGDLSANLVFTDVLGATTSVPLTLLAPPIVAGTAPIAGTPGGGTTVTITGDDLGEATAVHFGSKPAASFVVDSPTQITATSPPGTANTFVDVTVTNAHGSSARVMADDFAYANPPGAPSGVSATAGTRQATIDFTAPSSDGGSPITKYTVTSSPGGAVASGPTSPITVTGLDAGTSYRFSVTASNAVGESSASVSNAVTTRRPTTTEAQAPATSSYYGTPIDLEADVSSADPGSPTGVVGFTAGGAGLGTASVGAGGQTSGGPSVVLDVGSTVTASYWGDSQFEPSSGSVEPDIRPAVTATSLRSSADPANAGDYVTITATVANNSTSAVPFGSVQFAVDGRNVYPSQSLDGAGRASYRFSLASGSHRISAAYHDDTGSIPDFVDSQAAISQGVGSPAYTESSTTTTQAATTSSTAGPAGTHPPATATQPSTPSNSLGLTKPLALGNHAIVVSAQTNGAGVLDFAARASIGHRSLTYARGLMRSTGRQPVLITIRPTAQLRRAVARYRRIRVLVVVTFLARRGGPSRAARTWATLTAR